MRIPKRCCAIIFKNIEVRDHLLSDLFKKFLPAACSIFVQIKASQMDSCWMKLLLMESHVSLVGAWQSWARLEKNRFAMKSILTFNLGPILPPSFGSQSMGRVSMEAFLVISV